MPSRRKLLAALGGATAAGLAGCSAAESGGSDTIDCQTGALEHGDGDVLDNGAQAYVKDDDVRLSVPLYLDDVRSKGVDSLRVYGASGELAYVVPVSAGDADLMANKDRVGEGQLLYEQYLGERPLHNQYRIVAVNARDEPLDSVTVEFNCFPDVSAE
ncbi:MULTISPECIES: hypothetical protein [Halorussus]|uniref:hypothetical protein n=1 Tax=Halorussus TaxID=1070314 RepID=UPI000E20D73A|nr:MULTISPECIES: hypothetical protein [Halorussus]NHN58193.1 hypothetical protein [Halorussus sp. JP-T4]